MATTKGPRIRRALGRLALILLGILLLAAIAGWLVLRASLPVLEGERRLTGLEGEVTVERDGMGVPTIRAGSRADAARALGFLHGQERFFQMDLLRRQPAGELAELFGSGALESDRALRVHRFRHRAREVVAAATPAQRTILGAYAAGVNAGLEALGTRPFEYMLLRTKPKPWTAEDAVLVVYAMYLDLQDESGRKESSYGVLRETVPPALFSFLTSHGTTWDAPLDGSRVYLPPVPTAAEVDLRGRKAARLEPIEAEEEPHLGSNNFAVDGRVTSDGRAILAGDMHLGIAVPIIWYRASLIVPRPGGGTRQVTGVTLPGTPLVIAGSNGEVAWAFTNSYGDWSDLIVLDDLGGGRFRTAYGFSALETAEETIRSRDGSEEKVTVESTPWGPVVDRDRHGRRRALRWVAHDPRGVNLELMGMEQARTVDEAMEVANRAGMPAQNVLIADRTGRIAWTLAGAIPLRMAESDARLPLDATDPAKEWIGWVEPGAMPRIADPPGGRLWTANARPVGGEGLRMIGDGGFAIGARAAQIRDRLDQLERAREEDLLSIQLDDRAMYLSRWHQLFLSMLSDQAVAGHPARAELREELVRWGERASTGSVGYRVVRAWRARVEREIFEALTAPAKAAEARFRWQDLAQREHVAWTLASRRPPHLLPPGHESWDAFLLAAGDAVHAELTEKGKLADRTWGERNTSRFRHPLAGAIPLLGSFLEYPRRQLPGDWDMPRAQDPSNGASQRMVVSPGRESDGIFHMPGGQSGHPLSPHFNDAHEAWATGAATPFLPGATAHTLRLLP